MASEKLVIELWELIQKENKEKISYDDFENDLNKALNLPRDEVDRAISLMLSQAEVNPKLVGEYKGGAFVISSTFAATITSTIKYENQFIPGKVEYEARKMGDTINSDAALSAIIMTPQIIDNMIKDYSNLSIEEKLELGSTFPLMDKKQQRAFMEADKEEMIARSKDPDVSPEEQAKAKDAADLIDFDNAIEEDTPLARNLLKKKVINLLQSGGQEVKELLEMITGISLDMDIDLLTKEQFLALNNIYRTVEYQVRHMQLHGIKDPIRIPIIREEFARSDLRGIEESEDIDKYYDSPYLRDVFHGNNKGYMVENGFLNLDHNLGEKMSNNSYKSANLAAKISSLEDVKALFSTLDSASEIIMGSKEEKTEVFSLFLEILKDIPADRLKSSGDIRSLISSIINSEYITQKHSNQLLQYVNSLDWRSLEKVFVVNSDSMISFMQQFVDFQKSGLTMEMFVDQRKEVFEALFNKAQIQGDIEESLGDNKKFELETSFIDSVEYIKELLDDRQVDGLIKRQGEELHVDESVIHQDDNQRIQSEEEVLSAFSQMESFFGIIPSGEMSEDKTINLEQEESDNSNTEENDKTKKSEFLNPKISQVTLLKNVRMYEVHDETTMFKEVLKEMASEKMAEEQDNKDREE